MWVIRGVYEEICKTEFNRFESVYIDPANNITDRSRSFYTVPVKVLVIVIIDSKRYLLVSACLMQGKCFICSNF